MFAKHTEKFRLRKPEIWIFRRNCKNKWLIVSLLGGGWEEIVTERDYVAYEPSDLYETFQVPEVPELP